MKILLIGAGSVGTFFCGRAAVFGGAKLEVLMHRCADIVRKDGFHVSSILGDFSFFPDRVIENPAEVSGDIDAIVLATKVLPEIDAVKLLTPAASLPSHPPIVLIQNGVGIEDEISRAFPDNELISCVAYIGAFRKSVNHICHRGAGRLIMGRFGGGVGEFTGELAAMFEAAGISCQVCSDIALERWRKILWNLPFNPVSVLGGGLDTRELCDGGEVEKLCSNLMDEIIAVANACGVKLDRSMADEQIEYTRAFPAYKTSMLQDFESGTSLEVDAIIGNVVKLADIHRVDVPLIRCCWVLLASVAAKHKLQK